MEPQKAEQTEYKTLYHEFYDAFTEEDVKKSYRFKRPSPKNFERMQARAMKKPAAALKNICMDCIHPDDKPEFIKALQDWPGLTSAFGSRLIKSTGSGDDMGN